MQSSVFPFTKEILITVFGSSKTGVVGLNPSRGMDAYVRIFCVYALMCAGSGLARADPPSTEFYDYE
jgi:hypothetical protein